jgi:hypothetical protein
MTNREIRAWYLQHTAELSDLNEGWIAEGLDLEQRANRAWRIRHDLRSRARSMMENQLEIRYLKERDRRLWGNEDGPTFDQLVLKYHQSGLRGDEVYERILKAAQTTNQTVNEKYREKEGDP